MQKNINTVDKNSPEYFVRQIAGGRYSLLLIMIFTVINLAFLLMDTGRYFLFSASVPYYLTMIGMLMDYPGFGVYTTSALVVSAIVLALYLACWLLSKKRGEWIMVAMVLFILDTIGLVLFSFMLENPMGNILDLVLHIWAIVELVQAVRYNGKLKRYLIEHPPIQNASPEIN